LQQKQQTLCGVGLERRQIEQPFWKHERRQLARKFEMKQEISSRFVTMHAGGHEVILEQVPYWSPRA
jgi:hypothetical protein